MQRWWLAAVAVVGIALAIFLFPRPDTGGSSARDAEIASARSAKRKAKRGRPGPRDETAPELIVQLRSQPDSVYAGRLVAPWSAIRYALMRTDDADAEGDEIATEIRTVLAVLQTGRRDPRDAPSLEGTIVELEALAERLRGTTWNDVEIVQKALKRHDVAVAEYRSAAAGAATPASEETP